MSQRGRTEACRPRRGTFPDRIGPRPKEPGAVASQTSATSAASKFPPPRITRFLEYAVERAARDRAVSGTINEPGHVAMLAKVMEAE